MMSSSIRQDAAITFRVVIPARYASTRLPRKPLLEIAGKPMVVHVVERAMASGACEVLVATDHQEIADAVGDHGYAVVMTRADHVSGTDRIAEVAAQRGWPDHEIIVNVQGDEPLIDPRLIHDVAQNLAEHPAASISTACHPIHDRTSIFNPNIVKVIGDCQGYALYFSRAPIPYAREAFASERDLPVEVSAYRHIGIYGYRAGFLSTYSRLAPARIETLESLEQLRALWHGYRISLLETPHAPAGGVDTLEDIERVRAVMAGPETSFG